MFPLTRPFRQGLATAALFVFTVLPTAFVAVYAWRINRPGHIRDVEIELGRQLGLQVTLEAVRYPKPGELVYQGIVLRQEEPRGKGLIEIARAGLVRLVRSRARADAPRREPEAQRREPEAGAGAGRSAAPALGRTSLRADQSGRPCLRARPRPGRTSVRDRGAGGRVCGRPVAPDSPRCLPLGRARFRARVAN